MNCAYCEYSNTRKATTAFQPADERRRNNKPSTARSFLPKPAGLRKLRTLMTDAESDLISTELDPGTPGNVAVRSTYVLGPLWGTVLLRTARYRRAQMSSNIPEVVILL